ncbi:methyltransferase domain-containing protein [Aliidiomarina indica]|uniref:methyltransferase domain-containing protein n=1 Tax=Aliidiomarina indica TaxID=2749147 RepID=UPI00188DDF0C|nr:methyltransferase domain-containing protein [Aliidiomarina indica]
MTERTPHDRAFASDVDEFDRNIYATGKGKVREAVLRADLAHLIQHPEPLRVLDVGAGLGQVNSWFAAAGHEVTHTDISDDMVAKAQARHHALGLADRYRYHVADLQSLSALLANETFDVVLCHAVLEWLAKPYAALSLLEQHVASGGWLSLMFYNIHAKRMANMVYGNFDYVANDLQVKKKVRFSPNHPLDPTAVLSRMQQYPLTLFCHSGVRCFHDYLRPPEFDFEKLLQLELRYRQQEPYRALGRYQHTLFKKESL